MKTLSGFGNTFSTEAIKGALPKDQNSPQKPPLGLYAELLSGTAFTAPRVENRRSWLYRKMPSVAHPVVKAWGKNLTWQGKNDVAPWPEHIRWHPFPISKKCDFIEGMFTYVVGGPGEGEGVAAHLYQAQTNMKNRAFYNADGELLILPQEGGLKIRTEMGVLEIQPGEIAVIPRGIKFQVDLLDKQARGYVCENFGSLFRLPELGVMGTTGLANPRHFLAPAADFEDEKKEYEVIFKYGGQFWKTEIDYSPFDVVAWYGNYFPYKYDLKMFNTIGAISFDHPDPSIFTVLTSPSAVPGVANVDFVIFPDRWLVGEHTFRPPYYHRNIMSEFMGLIYGQYDAKPEGFRPGGATLHNSFSAHGPDSDAFDRATQAELKPHKLTGTMAFMFETKFQYHPTKQALEAEHRDLKYRDCWKDLKVHYR